MFCPHCGKETADTVAFCAGCGTNMATGAAPGLMIGGVLKGASRDALQALRTLLVNPVGGLSASFDSLGAQRAVGVGVAFGVTFAMVLAIAFERMASRVVAFLPFGGILADQFSAVLRLKLFLWGLACFAAMVAATSAARLAFRGTGSIQHDVYVAGTSLFPGGVLLLAATVLGAGNLEVIAVLALFAVCFTVMLLHAGCTRVNGLAERPASFAVPCILVASAWIAKVIIAALL